MIHNLPWFVFQFKNVCWGWGEGGGGGYATTPLHPFVLQNCVYAIPVSNSIMPVSHIFTTYQTYHYPWVISLVPIRICRMHESYHRLTHDPHPQYPWGYAVYPWVIPFIPVSHILGTCEDKQYLWIISLVPVSHVLNTLETYDHYFIFTLYTIQSCIVTKNRSEKVRIGDSLNIKSMLCS